MDENIYENVTLHDRLPDPKSSLVEQRAIYHEVEDKLDTKKLERGLELLDKKEDDEFTGEEQDELQQLVLES